MKTPLALFHSKSEQSDNKKHVVLKPSGSIFFSGNWASGCDSVERSVNMRSGCVPTLLLWPQVDINCNHLQMTLPPS